jgi:hypothetical protein
MDTQSDSNVVPFRVISNAEKPADRAELPEDMTQEQMEMYAALANFGNFLLENRDNIEYFVAMVAERAPADAGPDFVAHHVFTSPIKVSDFALCLQMLQNSFFNNINARSNLQ